MCVNPRLHLFQCLGSSPNHVQELYSFWLVLPAVYAPTVVPMWIEFGHFFGIIVMVAMFVCENKANSFLATR